MARGESEAIALALQERALLVGIDDKQGINACKLLGIPFTTAVAILSRSFEKGVIRRSDALNRLAALARYGRYRSSILRRRQAATGGRTMTKTMSIRMDRDNYEFLTAITKAEESDLSKAVRDLVTRGRVLLAVEKYKKGEASLSKAARDGRVTRGADDDPARGIRSAEQDRRHRLPSKSRKSRQSLVSVLLAKDKTLTEQAMEALEIIPSHEWRIDDF